MSTSISQSKICHYQPYMDMEPDRPGNTKVLTYYTVSQTATITCLFRYKCVQIIVCLDCNS